jgi:hypothetical protein
VRLTCQRPRQQRLARAGRAGEQHAARDPAAQAAVLVWILEESTSSVSSSLASSIPATSSKFTCCWEGSTRWARERPNAPIPPAARRPIHTNSSTSSSVGPKYRRIVASTEEPVVGDFAFTTTPF